MDIQTIASRARLPLRQVRYVLDHRLLPGLRVKAAENEVGRRRHFTDFEGFCVACAAALLHGGVKRETVLRLMSALRDVAWPGANNKRHNNKALGALYDIYVGKGPADVLFGDNAAIRLQAQPNDTGWLQPETGALLKDYRPAVTIQLDLARLRDALLS